MGLGNLISPEAWKERFKRYRRVIGISRKPDKDDFFSSAKITGSGIMLIGFVGFIIFLIYQLIIGLV